MANKKIQDIQFEVEYTDESDLELDEETLKIFINNLLETSKDKIPILEAQRIVNSKDPFAEICLILNYEEPSVLYEKYKAIKDMHAE